MSISEAQVPDDPLKDFSNSPETRNKQHPLLERLMILLTFSSSLDEFNKIRVSGLKKQAGFGRQQPGPDGKYPQEV